MQQQSRTELLARDVRCGLSWRDYLAHVWIVCYSEKIVALDGCKSMFLFTQHVLFDLNIF